MPPPLAAECAIAFGAEETVLVNALGAGAAVFAEAALGAGACATGGIIGCFAGVA